MRKIDSLNANMYAMAIINDQIVRALRNRPYLAVLNLCTLEKIKKIPCPFLHWKGYENSTWDSPKVSGQDNKVIFSTTTRSGSICTRVFNLQTSQMENESFSDKGFFPTVRAEVGWVSAKPEQNVLQIREGLTLSQPPARSINLMDFPVKKLIPFRNTILCCSTKAVASYDLITGERQELARPDIQFEEFQFCDGVLALEDVGLNFESLIELDFNPAPAEESGCLQSMLNCLMECLSAFCAWISQFFRACFSLN